MNADTATLDAYCDALRAARLDAPWSRPGALIASKTTRVEACHWRWSAIDPLLRRSATFVTPGPDAERRILRLANPGVPERTSTHTLSVAVQYLLPGETAPAHRHTPNAVRFMLRGDGAYTIVEGEKCMMAPGDLVLTPSMTWHEHGNEGAGPVIWLDGLDSPVVRYLEILGMQAHLEAPAAAVAVADASSRHAPVSGITGAPPATRVRTIHYPWTAAEAALLARADDAANAYDDVLMEYRDPITATPVLPTLGCYAQMLRPGIQTQAHRQTSSAVYHVFRGGGCTIIDGVRHEWSEGDFFAIPPLAAHRHVNDTREPAFLFSLQDVPLLRALGLYHEAPVPST